MTCFREKLHQFIPITVLIFRDGLLICVYDTRKSNDFSYEYVMDLFYIDIDPLITFSDIITGLFNNLQTTITWDFWWGQGSIIKDKIIYTLNCTTSQCSVCRT